MLHTVVTIPTRLPDMRLADALVVFLFALDKKQAFGETVVQKRIPRLGGAVA